MVPTGNCDVAALPCAAVKGIGAFVLLLVVGLGVAFYLVSRPPDTDLDAQGKAWVADFREWSARTETHIDRARVEMTFAAEARNKGLIDRLRGCSSSYARIGDPPELLERVGELATEACGRAQYAVQLNEQFGEDSLATIKSHLRAAGERIALSRRALRTELAGTDAG